MAAHIQGPGSSGRTVERGWRSRWTRRNVAAAALLAYASTFVWMTAAFAGTRQPPGGAAWALANTGALASLALFTLPRGQCSSPGRGGSGPPPAGAIIGLAALVPYGIAASSIGVSGPGLNSAIHIAGSAAVLLVVLVPALDRRLRAWLSGTGRPRKR